MNKVPITRTGYRDLQSKLDHLRQVVRPQVLEELQEARSYGVKVDNQQYLSAREQSQVVQRKIQDLLDQLARCEVVVGRRFLYPQVAFGTVIEVENISAGTTHRYELVGPYESDVSNGRLSVDSPVGSGLLGHLEGDEVTVSTPSGRRVYRILSVQL